MSRVVQAEPDLAKGAAVINVTLRATVYYDKTRQDKTVTECDCIDIKLVPVCVSILAQTKVQQHDTKTE